MPVHEQGFGVQHGRAVFKDERAGAQQFVVVGAGGGGDQARVAACGGHELDLHAAQGGVGESGQGFFGGHEVGRGQPDAVARQADGVDDGAVDGFAVVVGAAGGNLHGHVGQGACFGMAFGAALGRQHVAGQGVAAGVGPVLQEQVLQPAHGRAVQAQVGVAPGGGAACALVFGVGDVDAAQQADLAVANHHLAVGAQVHQGAKAVEPGGVKQRHLPAGVQQLAQRGAAAAVQGEGADGVHQQAHGHALAGALCQRAQHGLAGVVGREDVVLQMDVAARLRDGLQERIQRGRAAAQQLHVVAGGHGQAAAALDQPRVLHGPHRRLGALRQQGLPLALRKHAGALVPAAQALALNAPGAKPGVNGQSHQRHQA